MFEFILLGLVQNLTDDNESKKNFSNFKTDKLVLHQKQILTAVLSKQSEDLDLDGYVQ